MQSININNKNLHIITISHPQPLHSHHSTPHNTKIEPNVNHLGTGDLKFYQSRIATPTL